MDKDSVYQEIRDWSNKVLEKPNPDFNNLPACPFAKYSWNKNKVHVMIGKGGDWKDLLNEIQNFDDTYDVIIYCGLDYDEISAKEVSDRVNLLNEYICKDNLWLMGAHPDTEIEHSVNQDDYEPLLEDDYYQLFLQRLDVLVKASDSIKGKGYYKNYKPKDYESLVNLRSKLWTTAKKIKL
jgi:hypothetical protein